MKKILVIEDNAAIRQTLKDFMEARDMLVVEAERGDSAYEHYSRERPDLVILDLNLPGLDGIEVCRQIREKHRTPIIMLTARREEADQVRGLQLGADDYIVKPFSPKVLVLKVEKMLDRPPLPDAEVVRFKDVTMDLVQHAVYRETKEEKISISLSPAEFNLLKALFSNPRKAFSRDELIDELSDDMLPPDIFDRTIDSHIKNLRHKLGDEIYIKTVRGIGYQADAT